MLSKLLPALRSALVCTIPLLATTSLAQTTINVGPGQPYTTIQSGIDAAVNGDTVLVAPGTYYEHLNFNDKAITVISSGGAAKTILDGSGTGTVVYLSSASTSSLAVLDGFTVQHGYPDGTGTAYNYGGAVDVGGNAIVRNNIITNNTSCGVDILDGNVTVENNHILNNVGADTAGADCRINAYGILAHDNFTIRTTINILNNLIEDNQSGGVDVYNLDASTTVNITQNTIRENALLWGEDGIGVAAENFAGVNIIGNLITGNQGTGVVQGLNNSFTLVNNTIYGNSVAYTPQYAYQGTEVELGIVDTPAVLANNIVVGTSATQPVVYCAEPSIFDASFNWEHSIIYNSTTHTGSIPCYTDPSAKNIFADPQLSNPSGGDFHLTANSPAIDAGNNSAPFLTATDLDGKPRLQDATHKGYPIVDIGAYEYPGVVDTSPTTLTLTPSSLTPSAGSSITAVVTAISSLGTPTGPVALMEDSSQVGSLALDSGTATFTLSAVTPGFHTLIATYAGQAPFTPATSVVAILTVSEYDTTVTIASSPNPSLLNGPVTFTVTSSAPDKTVPSPIALTDTGTDTLLATLTPDSSGVATYTTSKLDLGYHNIEASYAGNSSYQPASAYVLQDVIDGSPTTTNLTCAPASISIDGIAALTATVTSSGGAPTGSFTFTDNGATLGQAAATNGVGTLNFQGETAGPHTIVATYVPTGSFAGSSASCTETVTALPSTSVLKVIPTTSTYGSPVTLTANVAPATPLGSGTPTGTVTFYYGASTLGAGTLSNGETSLTLSTLPGGSDNLTCSYSGNSVYAASTCNTVAVSINAAPTTTSLTVAPNPAYVGQQVTMTAAVSSQASSTAVNSGTVTFFDGATSLGSQPVTNSGTATFTISTLAVGAHPITATFNPANTDFIASTSQVVNESILASSFTIALTPATITLSPGATGKVAIQLTSAGDFAGPLTLTYGTLPANATAAISPTTVTLSAGGTASSTLTLNTVAQASTTIPAKPGSRGLPVVFTALSLLLVPFSLAQRRKVGRLLGLMLMLLGLQAITGCTNIWYTRAVVASGTYQLPVTATDVNKNTQTAMLTVVVSP